MQHITKLLPLFCLEADQYLHLGNSHITLFVYTFNEWVGVMLEKVIWLIQSLLSVRFNQYQENVKKFHIKGKKRTKSKRTSNTVAQLKLKLNLSYNALFSVFNNILDKVSFKPYNTCKVNCVG